MIELKSPSEIERMRQAGRIVAGMLEHLRGMVRPGMKTKALDDEAVAYIRREGGKPAFLGYRGFPGTICVSINEQVVHGIPGERRIQDGDVVSIDAGAVVEGFFADAATTVIVGTVGQRVQRLVEATRESLQAAITQAVVGNRVSDLSAAVQRVVERNGFGIVRDFVGHGIGTALHEDPPIPNFGPPHMGPRLKAGMVLAIEPMVTLGQPGVKILDDGWTAVTQDGSMAAHFEHTVAVTEQGPDVLTGHAVTPAGRR